MTQDEARSNKGVDRDVREYSYTALRDSGEFTSDTLYVTPDRRVWDVQEGYGSDKPRLAIELTRAHAAKWLAIRRTAPNSILDRGRLLRTRTYAVPHLPVGPYADGDRVVLHNYEQGYGRASGTDADGSVWSEFETDAYNVEHAAMDPDADEETVELCETGRCDCGTEECAICDKRIYDGFMSDNGSFVCADHIERDDRPDSLFTRVGAIRGEALPAFAWPGGYLIAYYTNGGGTLCADCASGLNGFSLEDDPAEYADALEGDYEQDHGLPAVPLCDACSRPMDPADRNG